MSDTIVVEQSRAESSAFFGRNAFFSTVAPYVVTFLLTILFYAPWFRADAMFAMGDYYDYFVPARGYATTQLRQGNLPEWTHDILGGFPFLSDPQTAVFYPGHLLLAALTDNAARTVIMDRLVFAHILLLSLGGTFLARSVGIGAFGAVAAALLIAFNGYPIMHLGHVSIIEVMAVGMWTLGCTARAMLLVSRRWAALAAMLLASCVFIGHPQVTLFLGYAIAAGGAAVIIRDLLKCRSRRRFQKQAMLGILIVGLAGMSSMVQILPTGQMLEVTKRSFGDMTLEIAMTGSLPARMLYALLFPRLYSPILWRVPVEQRHGIYTEWAAPWSWEYLFHIGVFAFALGLFGYLRNVRRPLVHVLFFGSMLVLAASMGNDAGIYPFLYRFAPGFQDLRIPPRMMWIAWTAWALLVGLGVEAARETIQTKARSRAAWGACLVIGAAISSAVVLFLMERSHLGDTFAALKQLLVLNPDFNFTTRSQPDFMKDIVHQAIFGGVVVVLASAWLLMQRRRSAHAGILAALAVAGLFIELTVYGYGKNIGAGQKITGGRVSFYRALPDKIPGRVLPNGVPSWRFPNMSLVNNYENASAYTGFQINCAASFIPDAEAGFGRRDNEKLLDVFNVSHIVTPRRNYGLQLNGNRIAVPDSPWVELGTGDPMRSESVQWKPTTGTAERIYVLSTAACAAAMKQGSEIAILSLKDSFGVEQTTYPLRVGIETAEWNLSSPHHAVPPAHSPAAKAFAKPLIPGINPKGMFYLAGFEVPSTASLSTAEIKVTAPAPVYFCVSHIILQNGASFDVHLAAETVPIKQIPSNESTTANPEWTVYERSPALGFAWMVPTAEPVDRETYPDTAREKFRDSAFDPARTVLLNLKHMGPKHIARRNAPDPEEFTASVRFARQAPEKLAVSTEASQQGWLVVSNTFYSGWRAYVDGEKTKIIQANGAHMAVPVPAGRHEVTLEFTTPKLRTGAFWSVFGWTLSLGLLLYPIRRASRKTPVTADFPQAAAY